VGTGALVPVDGEPDPGAEWGLEQFQRAGRTLASLGLIRAAEGNLSTFDGRVLAITRTGSWLAHLKPGDIVRGDSDGTLPGASSDLEVHRRLYREIGPGAVVHAHPPGTVPEDGGGPGTHGIYVFAPSLSQGVEEALRRTPEAAAHVPDRFSGYPVVDIQPVVWEDGTVRILDQRKLPAVERYLDAVTVEEVAEAIRTLAVRGAPLLGVTAGFGVALSAARSDNADPDALLGALERAGELLIRSRPTAVNVSWAVRRVRDAARRAAGIGGSPAIRGATLDEARAILEQEQASCEAIGELGAELVPAGARILTHCNTGVLATCGIGTAQGVILSAHRAGKDIKVWVDETRPLLQGARLTAWELQRLGIPMTLVVDSAAGSLMAKGQVDLVVVGADRISANGDTANKVGTYPLAVLAAYHGVPFYVAAPLSTVDPATPDGKDIDIEAREPDEVTSPLGVPSAPKGTPAANPAFDLTPAELITAIVTERGVARPPYPDSLARLLGKGRP